MQDEMVVNAEIIPAMEHGLVLTKREKLSITGVKRVISCDENGAVLETTMGILTVGGEQILVHELSVETGCINLGGTVEYLQYSPNTQSGSLLARLFR